MGQYTKSFFEGVVKSYDGRIYIVSLPDGQTAILKYSTVHKMCQFPESMLQDDHLIEGTTIKLCRIVKGDKVSILPDHRFYYSGSKEEPDEKSSVKSSTNEFMSLLVKASTRKELTDAVKEAMKLFSLGFASAAIILLTTLLNVTTKNK